MIECQWPVGCFQPADLDSPEHVCFYHVKVLAGLITVPLPGTPDEEGWLIDDLPDGDTGGQPTDAGLSEADVDTAALQHSVLPEA